MGPDLVGALVGAILAPLVGLPAAAPPPLCHPAVPALCELTGAEPEQPGDQPPSQPPEPRPPDPPRHTDPPPAPAEPAPPPRPNAYGGPEGRVSLNGGWSYRADPRNVGLARGWQRRRLPMRPVELPHSPNALPVTGAAGARNFRGSVGWYSRQLRVERAGRYAIRFQSVHHRAAVWLDGRRLGTHTGAYMPFEVRPVLEPGRAYTLTVRADWRSPRSMKRQGWHRGWFNFGGINREVTIRRVGASELGAPSLRTQLTRTPGGAPLAIVDVAIRLRSNGSARTLGVRGTLTRGEQRIELAMAPVRIRRGAGRRLRARVAVPSPALWSPADPSLYELRLAVAGEAAYRARVGLRELRWRGGRLYLNRRPLLLRGASLQEDAPGRGDALRPADQDRLVAMLRDIGANATRAQHPLDPGLLERLDAAGIVVWQHVGPFDSPGNWTSRTPALRRRARRRVRTSLAEDQAHPSILAWNLANEVAGGGHPPQARYIDRMARELHAKDPGRPVAVDVWGKRLPRRSGLLYRNVDAVGATNYIGWYERPFAAPARVAGAIRARIRRLRRVFPSKLIVVSEFGAEGNARNAPDRHGGYAYQARLIGLHLRTYRELPEISGALIWSLRDFALAPTFAGGSITARIRGIRLLEGLNEKGLFDYRDREKPAARVARDAFLAMGGRPR